MESVVYGITVPLYPKADGSEGILAVGNGQTTHLLVDTPVVWT